MSTEQGENLAKVRDRGEVLGYGVPAALFLPGVAYLGITNGHQFIANDFSSPSCTAWPVSASPRSR
ncbi:hypothetical protein [Streptomyces griseofuscus]|uniref:hypothetical protein n=1 Tax=Streptomyces griseofuscus TaxID=146922 RepID=UPI001187A1AE|nr:hypothetical protein [Streptomyces griseofuscus]BBC98586.1 hypothetical protein SRO_7410 [Streptomyces rochei]